jgi:hypothetical protein
MEIKKIGKFLSEMKKSYGEDFSLRDIEKGQVVTYMGTRYYVIDSNEVVLELSKNEDAKIGEKGNFFVNRNMFKRNGAIPD